MQKSILRKGLVVGIILMFVGVSIIPGLSKTIKEEYDDANDEHLSTVQRLFGADRFDPSIEKSLPMDLSFSNNKALSVSPGYEYNLLRDNERNGNSGGREEFWLWAKSAGGSSDDIGFGVAVDVSGNAYVTGYFRGSASFGSFTLTSAGSDDVFVAKLDTNGNWLWAKSAGGSDHAQGRGVAVDTSGNTYITGLFAGSASFGGTTLTSAGSQDVFVAKLDTNGNWLWARRAGSASGSIYVWDRGYGVAVDTSGNAIITGLFQESADFGSFTLTSAGSADVFVAKLDTYGNWLWARRAGGSYCDEGHGVAVDTSGNTIITGRFAGSASFGSFTLTSAGSDDVFVAKLDTNGNWLWARRAGSAGGSSGDWGNGVAMDASGNAYVTGYFMGSASFGSFTLTSAGQADVFVAKLDTNGNWLWARRAGGSSQDEGYGVAVDTSGNACITGWFRWSALFGDTTLTSEGDYDVFVAKLDTNGNWLWARRAGDSLADYGYGMAVDSSGNAIITGEFQGSADFGSFTLTSAGSRDVFVAKLSDNAGGSSSGWGMTEVVSTESTSNSCNPSLFVDSSGTAHVAWHDYTNYGSSGSDADIFYKRKPSGGSWTVTEVVSTESTSNSWNPSLFVDSSGTVHVAWEDYTSYGGSGMDADIFYKRKPAGGSWSVTEVVSTESIIDSCRPSLFVDSGGTVHVAWEDYTNYSGSGWDWDIFYKRKPVGGSWSVTEVVSTESTSSSWYPSLAVDSSGTAHVAWADYTNYGGSGSDQDIFYKRKPVGGSWSVTEVVSTESTSTSRYPSLFVDSGGTVHVAWQDDMNYGGSGSDQDIFYKRKPSGGSWTVTEVVSTESTSSSWYPSLFVDSGGTVHVAWDDSSIYGGSGDDLDIFYKYKPSGGSWSVTEVVSTESTNRSYHNSLFVNSSGTVHVAWEDYTSYGGSGSDYDIFYKRKVSNILANEIYIFSSGSMNLLNDIFSESQWTAQDGDYFQAKMKSDEIELVVDAIFDGISFGSGLSPTVQEIVNIQKLSLPGGIGSAYAHCLHIKEVLDPNFIRYLFINGYHPVQEVLQWALLYAAADIVEQGIDELTLLSAKELLKAPLKPQNALQTHFLPMLETNTINLLSVIQTTQTEVLTNMPTLTPEQVDLYKEDLIARKHANSKLASILSRQTLSLHQAQDNHESSGWSDKLLSFLFKFALRYLVWFILGPYGLILLAAIELGKNLYQNTQKLTENALMMELTSTALTNSFDTSKRIHLNTIGGLKNIQYSIPPQIAQGEIVSIQNHLVGPTWLWKYEIKTFTKEAYSDITVQNTGSSPSLQYLFAEYDVYNFWGTKNIPVVINSPLQTVNAGSDATLRVYYVHDSVGLCPSKGTTIYFNLLGETDTGIYYLDGDSTSFLSSSRGTLNETDLLPYPITNSLQLLPNSTARLLQIHVENPFNESISVNVTQGVPPDVTLIDADNGSISNNTILWHRTIPPLAFHCFNVTFTPDDYGNISYTLPATNLSIYDPVNDYHLYFETNLTIFTVGVPLRFRVIPPTEVSSGASIEIPCIITNLINETYAGNLSLVIRDTNTTVFNHTQGVSLNPLQVQEINITMNCSLLPGVYVIKGYWHSNNFTLPLFQESLSVDAAYVLGSILLQGGTNHSGSLVTLGGFTTQTDVEGYFTFLGIPMGNYTLSLTHPGYENASINVTLGKGFNAIPQLVLQKVNHPPFVPNNPSPANASQGVNLTETLSWFGGDPDEEDVVTYDVFFGTTTTPPQVSFNQSETSYSTGNLTYSTTYYWRVRAWDDRGASTLGPLWEFTTIPNTPPVYSIPSPDNNSAGHPLTMTWSIQISDPEGDLFDWTIQCSNGQTTSGTNDNNGTKSLGLSSLIYSTLYTVWVNATDPTGSGHYTKAWYIFTTKASLPPEFGTPSPANGSTNQPLSLTWSISINDPEGDSFDWTIECSNGQTNNSSGASNGTKALSLSGLAYSTTYTVWVNATDPGGSGLHTRAWYIFTTKPSLPPVFGTPTPANGSTNQPLSLSWSIPINDPEGDLFDWTIQCSNGQTSSGTGESNGTKSLTLSGLSYSATYTVWVNATDPDGSGLYTRTWYTFTTRSNSPPNKPERPSGETNGKINTPYMYTTSTTDPDGDQVYYLWDWGDGSQSNWLGPYDSGAEATAEHTWTTKGDYIIKVKAKDIYDAESDDWSDPLAVTMPYSYNPIRQFFEWLFQRFPNAFPILRYLMRY